MSNSPLGAAGLLLEETNQRCPVGRVAQADVNRFCARHRAGRQLQKGIERRTAPDDARAAHRVAVTRAVLFSAGLAAEDSEQVRTGLVLIAGHVGVAGGTLQEN